MLRYDFLFGFITLIIVILFFLYSSDATKENVTAVSDDVLKESHLSSFDHVPSIGQESTHAKNALITTDSLLFASTIDGTLFAVSKTNGKIVWSLKEDPVLNIPADIKKGPVFVANPKDGSLYSFKMGFDGLKKLSFTIPDLVTLSPCRSTDGLLYTGSKADTWFAVDPLTGVKIQTLSMDGTQQICPSGSVSTVYIGRTEYKVVMFDSETRQPRWNATFMDYSSHIAPKSKDYDLQHFASSSDGMVVTLDPDDGDVLWRSDFSSPVVAMYTLNQDHGFQKVPFFTVAKETLDHLTGQMITTEWKSKFLEIGKEETVFYPTLYVGEHGRHLYALPSLVDNETVKVTPKDFGLPLLEGPLIKHLDSSKNAVQDDIILSPKVVKENNLILLGYHEVPDISPGKLTHPLVHMIVDKSSLVIPVPGNDSTDQRIKREQKVQENVPIYNVTPPRKLPGDTTSNTDMKFVSAALLGIFFAGAFVYSMLKERMNATKVSLSLEAHQESSQQLVAADGFCMVGKISFNTKELLGLGCEGTHVFKGRFANRDVAVKRMFPHLYDLADREADLLIECDRHQNVIRYFCTEQDSNFRYIAFELCTATLHDYVEKKDFDRSCIDPKMLLYQMMNGIAHLHSLSIVHRDIKPQNVLLSQRDACGQVHVVISDFGLCKKLPTNRHSLSKVSGATGTEGWIAPEMHEKGQRITRAVDVFSAGCVLFYVLTNGGHPFSDPVYRQLNILKGNYDLSALSTEDSESNLAQDLVQKMVQAIPSERIDAESVLKHPYFWTPEQQLRFVDAVSNRLEKLPDTEPIVIRLESGAFRIVTRDWSLLITTDLKQDLRKFRGYKYYTVRDLLRAIRNKYHHYAELGKDLQNSLGQIPNDYMKYYTSRFPKLILHVYEAMECFSLEQNLTAFY